MDTKRKLFSKYGLIENTNIDRFRKEYIASGARDYQTPNGSHFVWKNHPDDLWHVAEEGWLPEDVQTYKSLRKAVDSFKNTQTVEV